MFPKLAVPMRIDELYSLILSRLSRVTSLDNGRIVAT